MFGNGFIDRGHSPNSSTILQIFDILLVQVTSTHVLIGTAISSFSCRHTVAFSSVVVSETYFLRGACRFLSLDVLNRLVEVLSGVVIRLSEGRAIEIVKH